MRILVIDDDDSVRSAVRRALLLAGYEVLAAASGEEGLFKVSTELPDAIVLDLGLPDIDGKEVCRRLRATGDRTPILMLTARVELDSATRNAASRPSDVMSSTRCFARAVRPAPPATAAARSRAGSRRITRP